METQNTPVEESGRRGRGKSNRPLGGLILVIIGSVFLIDRMDLDIPHWITSWPMILIGIGLFIGSRRSFQPGSWMVPIILGVAFLIQKEFLGYDVRHIFWPVFIICVGLYMILRPSRNHHWDKGFVQENSSDDFLDSSVVFGGVKKKIISKDFKGGKVENMFGGTDLDMMQADFKGVAVIEFNVAFGGAKLVIPPHWNIKNEVTVILGGIDDRRPAAGSEDPDKVLILRGSVMFGGIDIKSY